jgi:hypothetical protein
MRSLSRFTPASKLDLREGLFNEKERIAAAELDDELIERCLTLDPLEVLEFFVAMFGDRRPLDGSATDPGTSGLREF